MTANATATPPRGPALRARAAAPIALLLVAGVLACLPTWYVLAGEWAHSFSYAHGWLVVGVCAYLLIETAPQLPPARGPEPLSLLALGLLAGLYVLATYAHIDLAQQVLLPFVLLALVAGAYGRHAGARVAFPLLYLLLAIPVWDLCIPTLQHLTVLANGLALRLLGVPATIEGDLVRVPAGVFEVAGGCSGVHFFIVALAVSVLYGYLRGDGLRRALAGVAIAVALALATNWLRVLVIILRGNATDMQTSLIHDHYWFGWGLFAAALGLYFWIEKRLNPAPLPPALPCPAVPAARPGMLACLAAVAVLGLVVGWGYAHGLGYARLTVPALGAARVGPAFSGPLIADSDYRPGFASPAGERLETYLGALGRVTLYDVAYSDQQSGRKLIGYGSSVVPDGWREVASAVVATPGAARGALPASLRQLDLVSGGGVRWRVWTWYRIGARTTASAGVARWYQALQAFGALGIARQTALAAPCLPDCDAATGSLSAFAAILGDNAGVMTQENGISQ